jgi:nicotinamide-nucleotide amidase
MTDAHRTARDGSLQAARYLAEHGLVVVTAESCTAGLIAATLADVPGAGQVLESAFVVYDPKAKRRCLHVPAEVLENNNLTSEPVALAMARGALASSDATLAIANTGVADDSDPDVPAGTQCFAWLFRHGEAVQAFSETCMFAGERNHVRAAAAAHALARIAHYHRLLQPW